MKSPTNIGIIDQFASDLKLLPMLTPRERAVLVTMRIVELPFTFVVWIVASFAIVAIFEVRKLHRLLSGG